jgi:hypothetical protein
MQFWKTAEAQTCRGALQEQSARADGARFLEWRSLKEGIFEVCSHGARPIRERMRLESQAGEPATR